MPTGPDTEKRFSPLKVPPQFKATLFACDPLIEYPSVLSLGPRSNSIFLAHDYMTGLGEKIARRDEIRLVEDTDGDGYADKSTLWAGNFNSIQGLAYRDGRVFVMHSPFLTVLGDSNRDGWQMNVATCSTGSAGRRKNQLTACTAPMAWWSVTMAGSIWRWEIEVVTLPDPKGTSLPFMAAAFYVAGCEARREGFAGRLARWAGWAGWAPGNCAVRWLGKPISMIPLEMA